MSLSGKVYRLKSMIHLYELKKNNKNSNFVYSGDLLCPTIKISLHDGSSCHIGQIWCGDDVTIGIHHGGGYIKIQDGVCFGKNTIIDIMSGSLHIGKNCMFGPNVYITDHDHNYKSKNWRDEYKCGDVYIGENVWVGTNVTILKGAYIEDNCVIGAGMVVKGHYSSNNVYYSEQQIRQKSFSRD